MAAHTSETYVANLAVDKLEEILVATLEHISDTFISVNDGRILTKSAKKRSIFVVEYFCLEPLRF